jgi:hypothetical protein
MQYISLADTSILIRAMGFVKYFYTFVHFPLRFHETKKQNENELRYELKFIKNIIGTEAH